MAERHWVYVEAPGAHGEAGHTHLVAFAALDMVVEHGEVVHPKTICGIVTTNDWEWGDETLAAVAATCGRCLRIARPDLEAAAVLPHAERTPTPEPGHLFQYRSAETGVVQTVIVTYSTEAYQGARAGECIPADDAAGKATGWYIEFRYIHGHGGSYRTFVAFDQAVDERGETG